jgi:hypothetical protein
MNRLWMCLSLAAVGLWTAPASAILLKGGAAPCRAAEKAAAKADDVKSCNVSGACDDPRACCARECGSCCGARCADACRTGGNTRPTCKAASACSTGCKAGPQCGNGHHHRGGCRGDECGSCCGDECDSCCGERCADACRTACGAARGVCRVQGGAAGCRSGWKSAPVCVVRCSGDDESCCGERREGRVCVVRCGDDDESCCRIECRSCCGDGHGRHARGRACGDCRP